MSKDKHSQDLLALYRSMRLVRTAESSLIKLFADGEVPGFIHLSIGQEACAAGVITALEPQDTFATTHRGHGHVVARGIGLEEFFKELMGRAGGMCGGRGGSMHVSDMQLGVLGANGIVGAGIPIALGSALAHQLRKTGGVALAFFGDGAMAEGVLHESMNLASLWKLPLVFICENNSWSEFSPTERQFVAEVGKLASAFGLGFEQADGNDVQAVAEAARRALAAARSGTPQVLEFLTTRVRGHFEGDPQKYRPEHEAAAMAARDPLLLAANKLRDAGTEPAVLEQIAADCEQQVWQAIEAARADTAPTFADAMADVYTTQHAAASVGGN